MSRLYLIRHGKTRANELHLYCGSSDVPLSQRGAEELISLHYSVPEGRFLTSGMRRTNETLKLLFGDVPFETVPAFREIDFGVFELHSYEELKDDLAYQKWITGDNESNIPPEGESGVQVQRRVLAALPALMEENTVLITHGGVISLIMQHLFPEEKKSRYDWQPQPGHGYLIEDRSYQPIP